jgi:hypothetical protein
VVRGDHNPRWAAEPEKQQQLNPHNQEGKLKLLARVSNNNLLIDKRRKYYGLGTVFHGHIIVTHVESALIIKYSNMSLIFLPKIE